MNKLRIGLVGCGIVSEYHLAGWKKVHGASVEAVCDIIEERASNKAGKYGIPKYFTDYQEMLVNGNIDAVDICLPHNLHSEATISAAREGKHVLVQKPMANTLDEATAMINECEKARVKLMVCHVSRFNNVSRIMKTVIEQGIIGDLHMILCRVLIHKDIITQARQEDSDWKLDKEKSGGGLLQREAIHHLDLIRWLSGSEVTRLFAETDTFVWNVPFETISHLSMRFANGAIGSYDHTWFMVPGINFNEVIAIGSNGVVSSTTEGPYYSSRAKIDIKSSRLDDLLLRIPELGQVIPRSKDSNIWWGVSDEPIKSLSIQLPISSDFAVLQEHFTDCVVNNKTPLITGRDGARALELVIAAYRSAENKRLEELPLVNF